MSQTKLRRPLCLLLASALAASMCVVTCAAAFADDASEADLDLEADASNPSSKDIEQLYLKTTGTRSPTTTA